MSTTYQKRKEQGLCPRCGKVFTEGKICEPCTIKHRKYQYDRIMAMDEKAYKDFRDATVYSSKKRYKYLRENKLCTVCGNKLPDDTTYIRCDKCRKKHNVNMKKVRNDI